MKTEIVSFANSITLHKRGNADLLLTKPLQGFDVKVITFQSRKALESFNKKANLNAVIKTKVPKGCAIYRHEEESNDTI